MVAEYLREFQWSCVAFLGEELFALSSPSSKQIDVYNANDYSILGNGTLKVRGYAYFVDMAACCFNKCLYLADACNTRIVRLALPPKLSKWKVDDIGDGCVVSVTGLHDLLVLCDKSNKLKLFRTDGHLLMTVGLQPGIANVNSAMEAIQGHYLVTHGKGSDKLHRVCLVNGEGKLLRAGSHPALLDCPNAVAVDGDGFVYVIEEGTGRLVVLNPTLEYIHRILREGPPSGFRRMKMDKALKRIFIGHDHPSSRDAAYCVTVFEIEQ